MLSSLAKEHQQKQQVKKQELGDNSRLLYFTLSVKLFDQFIIILEKKRIHAIEATNRFSQYVLDTLNKEYIQICFISK